MKMIGGIEISSFTEAKNFDDNPFLDIPEGYMYVGNDTWVSPPNEYGVQHIIHPENVEVDLSVALKFAYPRGKNDEFGERQWL